VTRKGTGCFSALSLRGPLSRAPMSCLSPFLALVLLGAEANAQYLRTRTAADSNVCVTWSVRNFTYTPDTAGSAKTPGDSEFTAIDAAFSTWQALSDMCSDFQYIRGARSAGVLVGKGTQDSNVVVFRETSCDDPAVVPPDDPCLADGDSCINTYHCWEHGQFTLALTTTTYSTKSGAIYDADIELNAHDWLFTTVSDPPCTQDMQSVQCVATDIQNTLTHEIGHAMGFDHVNVAGSTMAPTAPIGEISKRIIDRGTADGFCTTYPRGQPPLPCDTSQQGLHIDANASGSAVGGCDATPGTWAALGLVALLRRSRSRRVT
jgi:hypothetical protein